MASPHQQRPGQERHGSYQERQFQQIDTGKILFKNIDAELFSNVAKKAAQDIAVNTKSNKPTQLRRFYDEIVMWDQKISMLTDKNQRSVKFTEYLPFIKMLNAKVAYAEGRKNSGQGLVDLNYVTLIGDCLRQVDSPETMHTFKLFMEAFMGFYKQERRD